MLIRCATLFCLFSSVLYADIDEHKMLEKKIILFVEDSSPIRKTFHFIINKINQNLTSPLYHPIICDGSKSATDYLNSSMVLPDLVFTDIQMESSLSGVHLAYAMRWHLSYLKPIIALTSAPENIQGESIKLFDLIHDKLTYSATDALLKRYS